MKYYGLKQKRFKEDVLYFYAKRRAHFRSLFPGEQKEFWKRCYHSFDREDSLTTYRTKRDNNSIPENGELNLDHLIISDLIRREDIHKLQSGVKYLLKKRRSSRFLNLKTEGTEEICRRIENMDSTLLLWYDVLECGIFEAKSASLRKNVDYYLLKICNINSAFLSVEFIVFLTDEMKNKIATIAKSNYIENRGYAYATLTGRKSKCGAFKNYSVMYYNNDFLKADRIYEMISCLEWEMLEELNSKLPLVLHSKNIMPPRIEVFYTNIDY